MDHSGSRSSSPGKLIGHSYRRAPGATGSGTTSEKRSKIPHSQGCSRETSPSRSGQGQRTEHGQILVAEEHEVEWLLEPLITLPSKVAPQPLKEASVVTTFLDVMEPIVTPDVKKRGCFQGRREAAHFTDTRTRR
ncbi:hypothetical protein NFI96_002393 [Prochilodus magdalenae]|nr:hypothetical protein NFI96_002393 [Prochilodus magdalenae]